MRLYSGGELRQPGFDFFGIVLDVLEFVAVEDPGSENIVEVGVYGSGIECIHFGQDRLERLPRGAFAEFVSESVHCFVECFFPVVERCSADDIAECGIVFLDSDFSGFEEKPGGVVGSLRVGQENQVGSRNGPLQRNGRVGVHNTGGEHRVVGSQQIDRVARRQFVAACDGVVCASATA